MKADTSVRWFTSEMVGAPVLRGQAGSLIEVLDACLVDGFTARTPDSFVVADGVATLTFSAGNPYKQYVVISITGASNVALNDAWRVASSDETSITFACPGLANGSVSGASVKIAPAGWGKPYSDTVAKKAVYKAADPFATGCHFRVDDSGAVVDARGAAVRAYQSMTDVDAGTDAFPTLAQRAAASFAWMKSNELSSSARPWVVIADQAFFYYLPEFSDNPAYSGKDGYCFGDFDASTSVDPMPCFICAATSGITLTPNSDARFLRSAGIEQGGYVAKTFSGLSAPYTPAIIPANGYGVANDETFSNETVLPVSPVQIGRTGSAATGIRGQLPGLYVSSTTTDVARKNTVIEIEDRPALLMDAGSSFRLTSPRMRPFAVLLDGWRA